MQPGKDKLGNLAIVVAEALCLTLLVSGTQHEGKTSIYLAEVKIVK